MSWLDLRNRDESLQIDDASSGRICRWADSSALSVARIFPSVGTRLLRHVLAEWPVRFHSSQKRRTSAKPLISILIPIGGAGRISQFELALAAARAQEGIEFEVIVVEQGADPQLRDRLPGDVRYLHQSACPGEAFNKSRALNGAASQACSELLVILDADYLLPVSFAQQAFDVTRSVEGARPARMLFYLDEASSRELHPPAIGRSQLCVERVVANNPTPLVVRRSTYWEIGGHDESYFGWGGEDTEFLDRLRTRRLSEGGWLPVLHVWHAPAPKKESGDRNRELHERTMAVPAAERIRRLTATTQRAASTLTGVNQ